MKLQAGLVVFVSDLRALATRLSSLGSSSSLFLKIR
ncbi:hypothetical protein HDE77_003112 [Rhodanobacter sp. MP7CTX1]|nr:hypothetical protein [Rhodanobacter sp. MP7CTX1]